ncbi:MAG: hypothetical protein R3D63_11360 [Paracoccaceae bacterium]
MRRKTLSVITGARVTCILMQDRRAIGVEYLRTAITPCAPAAK